MRLLTCGMSMNTSTAFLPGSIPSIRQPFSNVSFAGAAASLTGLYSWKRGVLYRTLAVVSKAVTMPFSSTRTRKCSPLPHTAVMVAVSAALPSVYS